MKKFLMILALLCSLALLFAACGQSDQQKPSEPDKEDKTENKTEDPEEHVHEWGEGVVTLAPTCTKAGEISYSCSGCEFTKVEVLAALWHDYQPVVTAPTCTEEGYSTYTCSRCGDSYTGDYTPAVGHIWDDGLLTKQVTDEEPGEMTYTCTICGETRIEGIPSPGHEYVALVTEPTCTMYGYTTYTCSHENCNNSYIKNYVPPLRHDYIAVVTAPTCTTQGYTTHTCSRCDHSYVDAPVDSLGHAWDEGVVLKAATSTETGEKFFTCSRCGETKTEVIPTIVEVHDDTPGSFTEINFNDLVFEDP